MKKVNNKTHNTVSSLTMDDVKLVIAHGLFDCTGCVFANEGGFKPCTRSEDIEECIISKSRKQTRFGIFVMKDDVRETIKT
jgi:hypothetical protein